MNKTIETAMSRKEKLPVYYVKNMRPNNSEKILKKYLIDYALYKEIKEKLKKSYYEDYLYR